MKHSNRLYHIEAMINEIQDINKAPSGDTRVYLSLDSYERKFLLALLKTELEKLKLFDRIDERDS